MWRGVRVRVLALSLILVSLTVSLVRPVTALVYMSTQGLTPNAAFVAAGSVWFLLLHPVPRRHPGPNEVLQSRAWTIASYNFIITLADAALEVWLFVAYRALNFQGKQENMENLRLLGIVNNVPSNLSV